MSSLSQNQQQQQSQQQLAANRHLEENNKRAYELLMRIQSQLEASTVIATATRTESNYE